MIPQMSDQSHSLLHDLNESLFLDMINEIKEEPRYNDALREEIDKRLDKSLNDMYVGGVKNRDGKLTVSMSPGGDDSDNDTFIYVDIETTIMDDAEACGHYRDEIISLLESTVIKLKNIDYQS